MRRSGHLVVLLMLTALGFMATGCVSDDGISGPYPFFYGPDGADGRGDHRRERGDHRDGGEHDRGMHRGEGYGNRDRGSGDDGHRRGGWERNGAYGD